MDYGIIELKDKMKAYYDYDISKKELGFWAHSAYYDLLKGGFIETKKIVIYPFLKVISKIHIESNDIKDEYPCSEEEVKAIYHILNGVCDFDFHVEMALPPNIQTKIGDVQFCSKEERIILLKLRNCLQNYLSDNLQDFNSVKEYIIEYFECQCENHAGTVLSVLRDNIVRLCNAQFNNDSAIALYKHNMGLYVGGMKQNLGMKKLLDYIDCYLGEKTLCVLVSYDKGLPKISLLI